MKKIALMVAMDKELELFTNALNSLSVQNQGIHTIRRGTIQNKEIAVAVSGIGKVNAALCASCLINDFSPDLLINIGISGGLDESVTIGDIIIGEYIIYHDVWCGEPNKYGQVQDFPEIYTTQQSLLELLPEYKKGLICCGDKFITRDDERQSIKHLFPQALAVDMESAAIAQTCWLYNIPLLCLRQISDTPGKHQARQYEQFWQNAPQNSFNLIHNLLSRL